MERFFTWFTKRVAELKQIIKRSVLKLMGQEIMNQILQKEYYITLSKIQNQTVKWLKKSIGKYAS